MQNEKRKSNGAILKFIFLSGVPKGYLSILNKKRNKFGTLEEYIK